jgi:serine/threonine protein kinase/tetratricopeptide (TPR) repeat protein
MIGSRPDNEAIFHAAREIPDPERRREYVREACGGDEARFAQVEALLAAAEGPDSLLDRPAAANPVVTIDQPATERLGAVIGPYKLIEPIGEGGMGTVWMAQQTEPVKRAVAVKLIKSGMDSKQVLARFEAERQALALMDHPNIARVLDAGATTNGRPYFVMELVKGVPITTYCDEHRLMPTQRLELFVPVCQAIQHAHHKGIIHRDIKPSNILIALYDGKPVPKVIDFGVAKAAGQQLTDKTLMTGFGSVVGTLEYMSPEQAELNQLDIDTRSDIYSLGVVLYELLTGSTPLDKKRLQQAAFAEVLRIIREEEPQKPSTRLSHSTDSLPSVSAQRQMEPAKLTRLLRGELDWIVMKALEKDRSRRYETANGFAMDVQRYLADEQVLACPPSAGYRLRKFVRRNKRSLAVAALVLFLLALLGGVAGWAAWQHAAQRSAGKVDIGRDLEAARNFCRQDRLREASAVLDHAQVLVTRRHADDELSRSVEQMRKDVDMGARLEEIRLENAAVKDEHFDADGAILHYTEAFRTYGLDLDELEPDQAAARIEVSAIREQLVAALDDWLLKLSQTGGNQQRLMAVLARADADAWRRQLRIAFVNREPEALRELARKANAARHPPADAVLLVKELLKLGDLGPAVEFLRLAQQEHPGDFWLNHELGFTLMGFKPPRAAEAAGYYRAAVALRPDSPGALVNLANALSAQGDLPGARAAFEKAIALKPDYYYARCELGTVLWLQGDLPGARVKCEEAIALKPEEARAHNNLGIVLQRQGDLPGALAAFQSAIALQHDYARAHGNLANVLRRLGDLPGAVAANRQAITIEPDYATYYLNLGSVLRDQGDLPGALAAYQKAIALAPDYADAHCQLGLALQQQGEFAMALAELRRGDELGSKDPHWRRPSAQWLSQCQRLRDLEPRLPDYVAGKAAPANANERIDLALLCTCKQRHGAAAHFYAGAFAAQPTLLAAHRYNAACAAALAGCGQGADVGKFDDQERARLRRQALDWLCAELNAEVRQPDKEPSHAAADVALGLQHWLVDPDLVGVREPRPLATLPPVEQDEWSRLWAEVAAQVARARHTAQRSLPEAPTIRVGQQMDMAGRTLAGDQFDLKQLRGKVVLIDFWASSSSLCVADMPNVKRVYDRYHNDGFEVVGVSLDHAKEALDRFVKTEKVPWLQLFFEDPEAQGWNNPLAQKYSIPAIPFTILVDQNGKVARLRVRGEVLEKAVAHLLGQGLAPPPDPLVLAQAHYYVRLSYWEAAAAAYAQADLLSRSPNDDAFAYACLFLIRGDSEGYNRFCQDMVRRAAKTKDAYEAYVLARSCAMARKSPLDPARATQWANQAVAGNDHTWFWHVLGLAQYRAGQFDQALESFTKANVDAWRFHELNWFGLALVHHRLGHADEARQCLAKGNQWLEREGPPGPEQQAKLQPQDWLEAQLLRREAEELLEVKQSP